MVKWRKLNQWEFPVAAAYGFAYARTFNLAHTRSNVPWLRVIVSKISKQLSSSLESQPYPSALSPAALRASKRTTIVFPPIHFSVLFFSTPVSSPTASLKKIGENLKRLAPLLAVTRGGWWFVVVARESRRGMGRLLSQCLSCVRGLGGFRCTTTTVTMPRTPSPYYQIYSHPITANYDHPDIATTPIPLLHRQPLPPSTVTTC